MQDSDFKRALEQSESCLFLCSGNIIRSAFAELYARHLGWEHALRSAGTLYPNSQIYPEAHAALRARGVSETLICAFRPQRIADLCPSPDRTEIVIGMTAEHLQQATEQGVPGPCFLLMEALGETREIADPYFEGGFEGVFTDIARAVEAIVG